MCLKITGCKKIRFENFRDEYYSYFNFAEYSSIKINCDVNGFSKNKSAGCSTPKKSFLQKLQKLFQKTENQIKKTYNNSLVFDCFEETQ